MARFLWGLNEVETAQHNARHTEAWCKVGMGEEEGQGSLSSLQIKNRTLKEDVMGSLSGRALKGLQVRTKHHRRKQVLKIRKGLS